MNTDPVPMTDDPLSAQPGEGGGETSSLQAAIENWQAVNRRTKSIWPYPATLMRTFVWIAIAIVGLLAAAAVFPTLLGHGGQPLVIHNPYVER